MANFSDVDQLVNRVAERLSEAASVNAALEDELMKARKLVEEKELEKIRALKEKDRLIEELEREKMNLQKDKEALEAKMDGIVKALKGILPNSGERR